MRIVSLIAAFMSTSAVQAGQITWSLENGFPLFRNADHFQAIKAAWGEGRTAGQFLADQNAKSLRQLLPKTEDTLWLPDKGVYDKEALFRKTHAILVQYAGAPALASCTWFLNGKQEGLPHSCSLPYRIPKVTEGEKFELRVEATDDPGQNLPAEIITSKMILGFGDSFSSGEGNPDHAAIGSSKPTDDLRKGYDLLEGKKAREYFIAGPEAGAKWWDATCHRSLLAWQSMYALHRAVSNPHEVVRFATFTCSGAEIYDGFFRAQLNPPVTSASERVKSYRDRNGGNYLESISVPAGKPRGEKKNAFPALNLSQLNAAIDLLCTEKTSGTTSFKRRNEVEMLKNRRYYGEVKAGKCSNLRSVDQALMSFGGNDFGFAGVVKWGIIPREVYKNEGVNSSNPIKRIIALSEETLRWNALQSFRSLARVIEPEDARKTAESHMDQIYGDVQYALKEYLRIEPEKVQALIYPNPIQRPLQDHCAARTNQGNVAMGELVVRIAHFAPLFTKERAAGFNYVITDKHAKEIEDVFVRNLESYQRKAIIEQRNAALNLGWTAIESQPAFAGRSLCAVSLECVNGRCSQDDLYTWTYSGNLAHESFRPISSFAQWEAYSSQRTRSLRTSNDALMTMARFTKSGKILDDWITGSMHPDARAHAAIADQLSVK
ncbi:hypothetical protein [Pseudomonas fluorescens]|nr:hypothetical protein [Pseudomonas fluorescens]MBT2311836.1 hypothetical protein [Pseudomonas fluorescens]MBT2316787.1 hypothetical protein [Pseudomonas fluorescens]MBT2344606.1 hypothetical protein [Pseudomonas fluorescens]MBT2348004.1 hypothetical protein [Pseudomonas fluorescens]MBT2354280.1 hypothetical protein [Pseudomonas fluorescens]